MTTPKTKMIRRGLVVLCAVAAMVGVIAVGSNADAALFCRSAACKAAQQKQVEYQKKANESQAIASTYEQAVANLNAEIATLEASINANRALADDIAVQIDEAQERLEDEQEALTQILINMHFEGDAEPISILAGSSSISDLAEKAARAEVAKKEITTASEKIKNLKAELEEKKAAVDSLIESDKEKQNLVASKKAEQASLMAKYQNDASAYAKDAEAAAEEARSLMEVIAEETALCQYSGYTTTQYTNDYPYRNSCPAWPSFYPYAGMMCQCTSYAGWKAMSTYGISFGAWGNAKDWGWDAYGNPLSFKDGYRVDTVVEAKTVAVSNCGEYGHVMWVEDVNADGTINVSEYNNYGSNIYHRSADFGARTNVSVSGLRFIHFR